MKDSCCSAAQSCPTLQCHGLQHARLPSPLLSPRVCSNSSPLTQWCHPTISFSVTTFSSCLQSFPASGLFPMNWLFASGGQSIGASASDLPKNIQGWFPLGLTDLTSLLLFNILSRFVIAFLPRIKRLLILWQQSLSTVILEPEKINLPMFLFFPIYLPWSDGTRCLELSFLNAEF